MALVALCFRATGERLSARTRFSSVLATCKSCLASLKWPLATALTARRALNTALTAGRAGECECPLPTPACEMPWLRSTFFSSAVKRLNENLREYLPASRLDSRSILLMRASSTIHHLPQPVLVHALFQKNHAVVARFGLPKSSIDTVSHDNEHGALEQGHIAQTLDDVDFGVNRARAKSTPPRPRPDAVIRRRNHLVAQHDGRVVQIGTVRPHGRDGVLHKSGTYFG